MPMTKLRPIQLPYREKVIDQNGFLSDPWRNALIDLQNTLNEVIKRVNQ